MRWLVDLFYLVLLLLTSPVWLYRLLQTGKIKTDWSARLGSIAPLKSSGRQRLLIHAVSVGEVNAVRTLVKRLNETRPDLHLIISVTTDTGIARARDVFGDRFDVVRYPLDFSFSVSKFLRAVRPDAVALVELEVWPNFTAACQRRSVPVCVINGRLSARSLRGYLRIGAFVRPSFRRLIKAGVQSEAYARRFEKVGVPPDRIEVTGTMKWDTALIADEVEGASELAVALGIDPDRPLVVAGSTAPGEHELLMKCLPENVQLLCAPRKPEWFDEAAEVLTGCARRSKGDCSSKTGRFLLDTIGELRMAYSLADVVVIGRSFGLLHGSDMIEPIALGKATIIGPAVTDFKDTMDALLAGDGIIQTDRDGLGNTLSLLLADEMRRNELAANGRRVIREQQGATERTAELVLSLLDAGDPSEASRT